MQIYIYMYLGKIHKNLVVVSGGWGMVERMWGEQTDLPTVYPYTEFDFPLKIKDTQLTT